MRARLLPILILTIALALPAGCGVAAGLTAPFWMPAYCLGGGQWCKPLEPGVVGGTVILENDADVAFVGLLAFRDDVPEPHEVSGEETPLEHGQYAEVPLPAGLYREIRVLAIDGTTRSFFDVIVRPDDAIALRLE